MRFFLDQDVDVAVREALQREGHECWTAEQAGVGTFSDDNLTVYAHDRGATLITHDREFSRRRRRNVVGQHIYLRCEEREAASLLLRQLEDVLPILQRNADVFIQITPTGFSVARSWS